MFLDIHASKRKSCGKQKHIEKKWKFNVKNLWHIAKTVLSACIGKAYKS
jgi:hypothetical protein